MTIEILKGISKGAAQPTEKVHTFNGSSATGYAGSSVEKNIRNSTLKDIWLVLIWAIATTLTTASGFPVVPCGGPLKIGIAFELEASYFEIWIDYKRSSCSPSH